MGELSEAIEVFTVEQVKDSLKRGGREFDSEEDLHDEAQDLADFLNSFGPTVEIFRAVHAKSPKQIDLDKLGNHWTHSEHKALDFARHELKRPWFLMSAKVKHGDIDWAQTLFQNVHHPHEEELYVLKKVLNPQIKMIEGTDLQEYFGSLMLPDREQNYKVLQGIDHSHDVMEAFGELDENVSSLLSKWDSIAKKPSFVNWWLDNGQEVTDDFRSHGADDYPPYFEPFVKNYDDNENPNLDKKKIKEWLAREYKQLRNSVSKQLKSQGSNLILYRCVSAEKLKDIDFKQVGTAWAMTPAGADCTLVGYGKGRHLVITALVPVSGVDVDFSLAANLNPHTNEEEIRVNTGTKIKITSVKEKGNDKELLKEPVEANVGHGSFFNEDFSIEEKTSLTVDQFVSTVSDVAKSLGFEKPGKAYFQCDAFSQAVRAVGESLGVPIKLYRADVQFRKSEGEIKQHEWVGHIFLKIGNMFYDFTARQFDPKSEFPLVMKTLDARYKNANAVSEKLVGIDDDSAFYIPKLEKAFSGKGLGEWIGKDDPYVEKTEWDDFLEVTRELGLSDNAARTIMNYNSGGYGIPWAKVKDAAKELETFAEHSGLVYRIHHYSKPELILKNHGEISVGDTTEIKSPKHLLSTMKKPEMTNEYVETGEYHVVFEIDVQPQDVFIDFTELPKKLRSLLHYPKDAEGEVVLRPGNYKARVVKMFHQKDYNKKVDVDGVKEWLIDEWGIPATGFYSDKFNKI